VLAMVLLVPLQTYERNGLAAPAFACMHPLMGGLHMLLGVAQIARNRSPCTNDLHRCL
jgi:hypothetical protein